MNLQEKVSKFAEDNGMTKDAIADQLGISRSTFFNRLRGDYEFSLSEAYSLSRILGVTLDELYELTVGGGED